MLAVLLPAFGRAFALADEHERDALGTRLMLELEAALPQAKRFELFTGENSARNLHLYAKLGYRAFRTEPLSPKVMLVFLEKKRT